VFDALAEMFDPRAPEYEDEFEWPEDKDWENDEQD
jgi:hypothetical protein